MEDSKKLVPSVWRIVAIAALCACLVLGALFLSKPAATSAPAEETMTLRSRRSSWPTSRP